MAITEDASSPAAVVTGTTATTLSTASFSPPVGTLLVAMVGAGWGSTAANTIAIADSGSHTWTRAALAAKPTSNFGAVAVYFCYLSAAPGAITVTATFTFSGGAGSILAVKVLNGAASSQSASTGHNVTNAAATTAPQITFTTTQTGSVVYGISDDPDTNTTFTPISGTTQIGSTYSDATDSITLAPWKSTNATGTIGSVTLGGSWGATDSANVAAFEVIPAPSVPGTISVVGAPFDLVSGTAQASPLNASINPTAIGNLIVVDWSTSPQTSTFGSISGGNCIWTPVLVHVDNNSNGGAHYFAIGVATATGAATANLTYSGPASTGSALHYLEFTVFGSGYQWLLDRSGTADTTTTTLTGPSLTPAAAGELYAAFGFPGGTAAAAGNTPGFAYALDASNVNIWMYDTNTSATAAPSATQSGTGSTTGSVMAALIRAAQPFLPAPLILTQAVKRAAFY